MAHTDSSSDADWEAPSSPTTPMTPIDRDPSTVTTASLQALQSDDQRKIMDIVDKLRRTGLNGVVSLPQLVVCGDQSSGKSSVLEAITEIPFPRKENLCTRFATEIILRRDPTTSIKIAINPDKNRPVMNRLNSNLSKGPLKISHNFRASLKMLHKPWDLAKLVYRIQGLFRETYSLSRSADQIARSLDLPGLIHATNKAQTEADKELILNLVKDYMKNPRTIILAIISAKNDFANQIILDYCKNIDMKSERTLGIITKPDYLREGSSNELDWIELAQNRNIHFKLGWHMLRNRADTEMDFSFDQRNQAETTFFNKGRYNNLDRDSVGIDSLRHRLSQLLLNHLKKELPSLKEEMSVKLQMTIDEIEKLGERRTTIHDQRAMLTKVTMGINGIIKSALEGHYFDSFFGCLDVECPVDSGHNLRWFRATVQYLNTQFANDLRLRGHKFNIAAGPGDSDDDKAENNEIQRKLAEMADDDDLYYLARPKPLTRQEAITWAQKISERCQGLELKGDTNHFLISQLFWEQSQPWKNIALEHVRKVAHACKEFIYTVLEHSCPAEIVGRLASLSVDAALAGALQASKQELHKILDDRTRSPMTYNHYFTTTLQNLRQRKQEKHVDSANEASQVTVHYNNKNHTHYEPAQMKKAMADTVEQDMDKFTAEEALDKSRAYYKDESKYFVNVIAKQVIERHLVEPLPDIVASPLIIHQLTDAEVALIAAEPPELTQQRVFLASRKDMLEKGMETFREAMGGLRR